MLSAFQLLPALVVSALLCLFVYMFLRYRASTIRHLKTGAPLHATSFWLSWLRCPALIGNAVEEIRRQVQVNGGFFRTYTFGIPLLVISEPELIEEVLVSRWRDFPRYPVVGKFEKIPLVRELLEGAMVTATSDDYWKLLRRMFNKAFTPKFLAPYADVVRDLSSQVADKWTTAIARTSGVINVNELLFFMAVDVMGRFSFDADFGGLSGSTNLYELVIAVMDSPRNPIAHLPFVDYLGFIPAVAQVLQARKRVRALVDATLAARRASNRNGDLAALSRPDVLDLMLEHNADDAERAKLDLSDTDMLVQSMMFIGGGAETTSIAMTWAMYLLAHDPERQDRARKEAMEAYEKGQKEGKSVYEITAGMEFLDWVCKETLRLYPPLPIIGRATDKDQELNGYLVPKGSWVVLPYYALHRNEKYYERPDEFVPERWEQARSEKRKVGEYCPFNLGARDCIGARLSIMEMLVVLSEMLLRFRFSPAPGFKPEIMMGSMRPKYGMDICLEPLPVKKI